MADRYRLLKALSARQDLICSGTKVRSNLLYTYDTQYYWVHLFVQKTREYILKEKNSTKGFFFYIKTPNNFQCCIYKVSQNVLQVTDLLLSNKSSIREVWQPHKTTNNRALKFKQSKGCVSTQYSSTLIRLEK